MQPQPCSFLSRRHSQRPRAVAQAHCDGSSFSRPEDSTIRRINTGGSTHSRDCNSMTRSGRGGGAHAGRVLHMNSTAAMLR